jgi:hypothetical protein
VPAARAIVHAMRPVDPADLDATVRLDEAITRTARWHRGG